MQTFTVTGGAPPFAITAGGAGCLDTNVVLESGGTFTFTAGDVVGDFPISVTDSLHQTTGAVVSIVGVNAAFIKLDLVSEERSDNGDGTFTSIVGALVTDDQGTAVANDAPVQFVLIDPVAGISVTNPGFINQDAPCTPGFTVAKQPGDALSCIKYVRSLQGATITIRARVRTSTGDMLEDTRTVTLPDMQPTATATITRTPSATRTPAPTPAAAHLQIALFVNQAGSNGDGTLSSVVSALVTDANGVAISNGIPVLFSLAPPVRAGVSVTSPGLTGEAAPCTLPFAVAAQPGDALSCVKYDQALGGETVTIQAVVQGVSGPLTSTQTITLPDVRRTPTFTLAPTEPPIPTPTPTPAAAFIQIALFTNQASDNGDGTLSSVLSAVVTTATGAAVGNGLPVQFRLQVPAAGVSVTSPGLVGAQAPCTLSFPVVAQPGDAFSCVKYDRALQGQTVTIEATVPGANGLLTSTQTIVLPDLRPPTPTLTFTPTPTSTPTVTPTPTPAAAHIQLALFIDTASSNGDGTLSSVVSALVTDVNGAAVGNGVSVQFSLVAPVPAGVSVTSPGLTGQPAPCTLGTAVVPQPGDALSCVKYDSARQGQTVTIQAVVQTPSGPLTSTQTIVLPAVRPTTTPTATPTPTPMPAMSIHFVSANPSSIGVRQSGLPEQSVLTFEVTDANNHPVSGVAVKFTISGVDDETLFPLQTVTDQGGLASTTVTTGVRAATIRVVAAADPLGNGTFNLLAQSTAVGVFGAPPAQNRFSAAPMKLNVAGRVFFGIQDPVTAFVNDRFGNAVPPGTAVTFASNGASVVNPMATEANGQSIATLITEEQVPPTGIVTVLTYTRGEEGFQDNNGNGVFDAGIDTILDDNQPEPFIDFRPLPPNDASCPIPPPSSLCNDAFNPGAPFELFVDVNHNGIWDTQGTPGVWDNNIVVFYSFPVTFSGHLVMPILSPASFTVPDGGSQTFTLEVHDDLVNPLVGGSTITITATVGVIAGGTITIPDGESFNQLVDGLTQFHFALGDALPPGGERPLVPTTITITIHSQNGDGTFVFTGLIHSQPVNPTPTPAPSM